jgi:hypothetical protein
MVCAKPAVGMSGVDYVTAGTIRTMETERINQIASRLADLQARSAELRRYL